MARHLVEIDRQITECIAKGNGRLILATPPRHGKSELTSRYLPAWYVSHFPHNRVILTTYEASFAASWGRKARQLVEENGHHFGVTVDPKSHASDSWTLLGADGGMSTAGVGGPITGKGADLLIVDDAVKNYEEAQSEVYREKTRDWFSSTAYTRLEPGGSVVIIGTRWHEDDLPGWIERELSHEGWKVVRFPAIAEQDDPLGRTPGEALWPERYPIKRLLQIKQTLGSYQFSALYQQRPTPDEGGLFKRPWFSTMSAPPAPVNLKQICRGWDKAGTERGGDYSAGVLMGETREGLWVVLDVIKGQWSSFERNKIIYQTAQSDCALYGRRVQIWVEQEPGSGGKESAEYTIRQLAGYYVQAEKPTGDKSVRAQPFAAQCEAGNVRLVQAPWNKDYVDELCLFPNGTHDDQVDASALAFSKLALASQKVMRLL